MKSTFEQKLLNTLSYITIFSTVIGFAIPFFSSYDILTKVGISASVLFSGTSLFAIFHSLERIIDKLNR